ncbi:P-loop NTPase family protein [Nitrincola tapanii]|uniref:Mobilization protein MobD n=1 Tax=Nitrincola tapanii TaxID=1708751 RepID=A0A5A9W4E4_9GAMM|nr:mobilization protein MobD [Nitrincola tapanii]KAA0875492.1 mobilization protein MobD [Nitrincola tapanii]
MKCVHLVGGEKGGVGKSVMSRLLAQYCLDHQLPFIALDADPSHATLSRSYGEFARSLNLESFESADQIIEVAVEEDVNVTIDLPAQSERLLERWIDENGVLSLCEELGLKLIVWYVVDDGPDSADLLERFLQRWGAEVTCILVKNFGRGADFSRVEQVQAAYPNLACLELPALHAATMRKIDNNGLSFWAAVHNKEIDGHLGMMERQRVRVWQKKAFAQISELLA